MLIYNDIFAEDFLIRTETLKTVNHYKMKINGWYCGGFSAPSDTVALSIFKEIIEGEK